VSPVGQDEEGWFIQICDMQGRPKCKARIDEQDVPLARAHRWSCGSRGYVYAKGGTIPLHRAILQAPKGTDVDHRDGDPLNNRRANLRLATRAENLENRTVVRSSTGHRNVYKAKGRNHFNVRVRKDGKDIWGGQYEKLGDATEAAKTLRDKVFTYHTA
jgi:hypothetical protein